MQGAVVLNLRKPISRTKTMTVRINQPSRAHKKSDPPGANNWNRLLGMVRWCLLTNLPEATDAFGLRTTLSAPVQGGCSHNLRTCSSQATDTGPPLETNTFCYLKAQDSNEDQGLICFVGFEMPRLIQN